MSQESEHGACHTFGQFLQVIEDGQLHGDLSEALQKISAELSNYQMEHGGTPKATLTLKIDFKLDRGVFEITPKVDTKLPASPRGKSVLWSTPSNLFTPANPKQMSMFGGPRIIDATTETKRVDPDRASS